MAQLISINPELELTPTQYAERTGKSPQQVSNMIRAGQLHTREIPQLGIKLIQIDGSAHAIGSALFGGERRINGGAAPADEASATKPADGGANGTGTIPGKLVDGGDLYSYSTKEVAFIFQRVMNDYVRLTEEHARTQQALKEAEATAEILNGEITSLSETITRQENEMNSLHERVNEVNSLNEVLKKVNNDLDSKLGERAAKNGRLSQQLQEQEVNYQNLLEAYEQEKQLRASIEYDANQLAQVVGAHEREKEALSREKEALIRENLSLTERLKAMQQVQELLKTDEIVEAIYERVVERFKQVSGPAEVEQTLPISFAGPAHEPQEQASGVGANEFEGNLPVRKRGRPRKESTESQSVDT